MAHITVLGGTGYAGSNIVKVAAERGHTVVAYSRKAPAAAIAGVEHRIGDVLDDTVLQAAVTGTEVVVSALSPRGELSGDGRLRAVERRVGELARERGIRFGVIGGAGSLLVAEGGPKLIDSGFPEEYRAEATELDGVLQDLRASEEGLDWFFVSPAAGFGAFAPGEATGVFRIGGDVLLNDEQGVSFVSGADLALAVVQEIEQPAHRRARFTVAY